MVLGARKLVPQLRVAFLWEYGSISCADSMRQGKSRASSSQCSPSCLGAKKEIEWSWELPGVCSAPRSFLLPLSLPSPQHPLLCSAAPPGSASVRLCPTVLSGCRPEFVRARAHWLAAPRARLPPPRRVRDAILSIILTLLLAGCLPFLLLGLWQVTSVLSLLG